MAKIRTLQIYRGTTAQNDAYTGSAGELTMDTTTNELRLHDGSTAGGHIVSGTHPDLFDHKWSDYELSDMNWLRADTFSWQSKSAYTVAYNHLADDISGKSLSSETVGGVTIQFYLADDGHKICPDSQENNVVSIYNATGVAWYYIIDTVNERFKLPRINPDKAKIINSASVSVKGTGKALGLIDGTGYYGLQAGANSSGTANNQYLLTASNGNFNKNVGTTADTTLANQPHSKALGVTTDASKSGLTGTANLAGATSYFAGGKYLYFYVGNFTQTALENTAGLNASLFNNKVDIGHDVIAFQEPTANNNYTWYRLYRDGWVEQGGKQTGSVTINLGSAGDLGAVNLPVAMANTQYYANAQSQQYCMLGSVSRTTTKATFKFVPYQTNRTLSTVLWEVKGMAA